MEHASEAKFKEVLEKFRRIVEKRPSPSLNFFQGHMLEQDIVARTALMHNYDDLDGKAMDSMISPLPSKFQSQSWILRNIRGENTNVLSLKLKVK